MGGNEEGLAKDGWNTRRIEKHKKIDLMVIKQQREGVYITNGFDIVK